MGNEMGNRNVSGLQEEDKAVGEEIEKNLVRGDCEDEVNVENHVVPDVKDKDFHEKVGQVLGDGNSLLENQINEKGQENESNELKLSSQLMEMEVPKKSDDNKPVLDFNYEGDTLIQGQITTGKETEKVVGSTIDSTSLSSQEKFEVEIADDKGDELPVIDSRDELMSHSPEPKLFEKNTAEKENDGKDANINDGGEKAFPVDDSEQVCESVSQEAELMSKDQPPEEEKDEVASIGDEGIGFPLVGSLDSSQEFVELLERPNHLIQEPEFLVNEKEAQEDKCEITNLGDEGIVTQELEEAQEDNCEVTNLGKEGIGFPPVGSQEPEMLVNEKAAQEEKRQVTNVHEEEIGFSAIGSQDTTQEVSEPSNKLHEETKYEAESVDDDESAFSLADSLDACQEILEPQGKSIDLPQEGKYEDGNDFQMVHPSLSSQEVCDTQEKTIGLTQETESIVKEKGIQEEKIVLGGNNFPMLGSIVPSQEITVPTELTVTKQNRQENKSSEETITRKSPTFDFDLSLESRPSQDSDRTPLLSQDKGATRSQSSRGQQTYQYSKVPLEDEEVSVEEKTIMMERSYSEKSNAPFMRKEEKGSVENKEKEGNIGGYKKAEEAVMLSSGKGKRKPMSSFFATCICCDVSFL